MGVGVGGEIRSSPEEVGLHSFCEMAAKDSAGLSILGSSPC